MLTREALTHLYTELSTPHGLEIADLYIRLADIFANRSDDEIEDYRVGKRPWKTLRNEIMPVYRFLEYLKIEAGRIHFPLDNKTPDCWLLDADGGKRGIEVTVERGREKYHLAKELNENGMGRSFIGVQDDSPQEDFDLALSKPRSMYSPEQALDAVKLGVIRCLSRKSGKKFDGVFYLLILADLSVLSAQRWTLITDELSQHAANLPFKEVYVVGDADAPSWGFRIK